MYSVYLTVDQAGFVFYDVDGVEVQIMYEFDDTIMPSDSVFMVPVWDVVEDLF